MREFLITLSLFILLPGVSISQPEQSLLYSTYLGSTDPAPEMVWAATIHYNSLSDSDKQHFLDSLSNRDIKSTLERYTTSQSILRFSKKYKDEQLFLAYLLNERSADIRATEFEDFYSLYSGTPVLKKLNHKIVREIYLDDEFYKSHPEPFTIFLLDNYNRLVKVTDHNFYQHVINQKDRFLKQEAVEGLNRELYLAAYFNALYTLNRFSEIEDIYSELIKFQQFPISYEKRNLFWGLDYAMYTLGYLDRSLQIQREFSLPLSDYLKDERGLQSIFSSHGGNLYMLGKYREAREVFESTLRRSENLSDQNLTRLYNNLSLVYFKTGESGRYVETQLRALELAQSNDDYDHQIQIYRNLHIFYRKNQNIDLALQYINQAADLAEELGKTTDLISNYISRAVFEKNINPSSETAFKYLENAQALVDENTPIRTKVRILSEKSAFSKHDLNFCESLKYQNEIIEIGRSQNDPSIYLEALVEIADLKISLGDYKEAAKILRDSRSHDITVVDFSVLTLFRMLQAKLHHHNGEFKKAEELYSNTSELVLERARYTADHETGYWTIEREYMQLFEAYADYLIDQGRPNDAVQLLDQIKTINDASLLQNPLITSTRLTEEELSRDRQISNEMETLRRKLFVATGSERLQLNNQLQRLQAQKRELFQRQRAMPESTSDYPLWSVRRALSRDQILLHITAINDSYYISEITRESTQIRKIESSTEFNSTFEKAIEGMITGRTDLNELYNVGQILRLPALANSYSSLIVIPDGYLHQLPLDVIPLKKPDTKHSYGSTTFLIEEMDVRTLNRLSDLGQKRVSPEFEYDFTGFGVADFQNGATARTLMPLPKAPGEVVTVAGNLNRFSKRNFITEAEATPQRFKEIAGNSRILHMATHSEISESDPLFSRLHLLPDQLSEDPSNQIFAYELFELDLRNELIMLNSCESGGDRAIQGSGIMGLSRALQYAGAQSLILNAWSVNDQFAADFAEQFYIHINNGESKSRALQLTKIDFIKNKNANPHFWGPYILNGNNQPLIQKRGANLGNWLIAVIFIAGFILVSKTRQVAA